MELTLSKSDKLLVLTPIQETFGEKENIIFLGSWCNAHSKREFFTNRNHTFLRHPYNVNKKKFLRDQKYLKVLRHRLLESLTKKLNNIHKINYSKEEWKIILGYWILIYTNVLFDRWEILRLFFLNEKYNKIKVHFIDIKNKNFKSTLDFTHNSLYSDIWNHRLFKDIINFKYKKKTHIKIIKNYHKNENIFAEYKFNVNLYFYIKKIINKILIKFAKFIINFNHIIFDGLISKKAYFKFCYRFKIIPFDINLFFDIKNFSTTTNNNKRNFLNEIEFLTKNDFEKFLIKNIKNYLPDIFIEKFTTLRCSIMPYISNKKKLILSQIAFHFNDIFNIWLVEMLKKKSIFFPSHHGGSLIFQNAITVSRKYLSKKFITWHKPIDKQDVQLSPLKLVDIDIKLKKNRQNCLIITNELPRYYYMFPDIPVGENNLNEFLKIRNLMKFLKEEIIQSIIFRNSPNTDWGYKSLIKEDFKNSIKFSTNNNIFSDFKNTKLLICGYPSTPFSESINLDIPSIFFFSKKNWNIHTKFRGLLDDMQNENLFFEDEKLASNHINQIWHNIDSWWNKSSVQKVISQCKKDFFKINKNWLNEYNNFFNKHI